jgi:uncharacterized protein YutE (UPF0331/DUF86 family)
LLERGVLNSDQKRLLDILAGNRNRMVHFYHEISAEELRQICAGQFDDVLKIQDASFLVPSAPRDGGS